MARKTLAPVAVVAMIVVVGPSVANRAAATEPKPADMKVISSDATAHYVSLGINKAFVIELKGEIKDVLVGSAGVVNTVVRTNHRVYVIGMAAGQTNVYFFDANGQQIGAMDIAVTSDPRPLVILDNPLVATNMITVYRGLGRVDTTSCTPRCTPPAAIAESKPDQVIETRSR